MLLLMPAPEDSLLSVAKPDSHSNFGCVCRGGHIFAAVGQSIRIHDVATTAAVRSYTVAPGGQALTPLRVEGTRDDRLVFAGAALVLPLRVQWMLFIDIRNHNGGCAIQL